MTGGGRGLERLLRGFLEFVCIMYMWRKYPLLVPLFLARARLLHSVVELASLSMFTLQIQ